MNKNKKFDIYQTITNQIIEVLESHKANNFTNNWFPSTGEILASNPVSKSLYRGFNQLYLSFMASDLNYSQNRWVTLKQANEAGGKIKTGQKSLTVTFWLFSYKDKDGKNITKQVEAILKSGGDVPEGVRKIPVPRYYNVFNLDQCEGLPDKLYFKGASIKFTEPEKDELAEELLKGTGAKIKYAKDHKPCYYPGSDKIVMPERKQYKGKEHFYSDILHELGHWTGHPTRLDREMNFNRTSREYAFEELIAELCSAFTSASLGFTSQISNNAAYIDSWLNILKNETKFVYQASKAAQGAADYLQELVTKGIALKTREDIL